MAYEWLENAPWFEVAALLLSPNVTEFNKSRHKQLLLDIISPHAEDCTGHPESCSRCRAKNAYRLVKNLKAIAAGKELKYTQYPAETAEELEEYRIMYEQWRKRETR